MNSDRTARLDPLARHSLSAAELKMLLGAERAGQSVLAYRDADGALQHVTIADGRTMTIGRASQMDLSISWDPEVSGLHAQVQSVGGEWTVVDDGLSTNGTFVNGQRLAGRQRLRDGDRIRVGETVVAYKRGQSASGQRTVKAAKPPELQLTDMQRRVLIALCRPYRDGDEFATPPTNAEIAAELYLSVDAVKTHLRTLFVKTGLSGLAQNEKRARLAEYALRFSVVSQRDLG